MAPDFVILGAAKAGTTALYQYLSQVEGVFLTDPKEPHYLALGDSAATFTGPGDDITINAKAVTDRQRYLELFDDAPSGSLRGEGSTSSLYYASEVVGRLRMLNPDVRMIYMLREPAARAWSAYSFLRSRLFEPEEDFDRALALERERVAAGYHHMWHYRGMSRYGSQLEEFYESFPRDQLKCVIYEDFRLRPLEVVDDCLRFIGHRGIPDHRFYTPSPHVSGEPRSSALSKALTRDLVVKRALKPLIPPPARSSLRRWLTRVAVTPRKMPDSVRRRLHAEFADDVAAVARLAGVDPRRWWSV